MRVLLINSNRCHHPWPVVPAGLCQVAAATRRAGHEVSVLDLSFTRDIDATLARAISASQPELVGVSIRNIDAGCGYDPAFFLPEIRARLFVPLRTLYDGPIVIGGAAVNISGVEMVRYFNVDYGLIGDGEQTLPHLLAALEGHHLLAEVTGLIHKPQENDPAPARLNCLRHAPTPVFEEWLSLAPYLKLGAPVPVQTKRGCALRCSYCTYRLIEGRRYRLKDPAQAAEEIIAAYRRTGAPVEITDSTFNLPLDHAKAILDELLKRNETIPLRAMGINPAGVDRELVRLMMRAGFTTVDVSLESADDEVLAALGKTYNQEQIIDTITILRAAGLPACWFLIAGGPAETSESLKRTLRFCRTHISPWDLIIIGAGLRVYKGALISSEMAHQADSSDQFLLPTAYENKVLSQNQMEEIITAAAVEMSNLYRYQDAAAPPSWAMHLLVGAQKRLAPHQPIWRAPILWRRLRRRIVGR